LSNKEVLNIGTNYPVEPPLRGPQLAFHSDLPPIGMEANLGEPNNMK